MPKKSTAESSEKKNYATTKQIASLLKITEYEVKKLVRIGMPKAGSNKFNVVECVHFYVDHLNYWRERRTIDELAQMLGITPRWLNRLVAEKGIYKEKHGVYNISSTVIGYVNFLKEQLRKAQEGDSSLADEKKRLLRMQANLRQMEYLEKQKKLIPVELFGIIILEFVVLVGKKLDSIPGISLNKLFASKTKEEMLKVLRDTIHHIKNEISRAQSNIKLPDSGNSTSADSSEHLEQSTGKHKTKTGTNRKSVG